MAEINGIAHIQLSVTNMERSIDFYSTLLPSMGLKSVIEDRNAYCYWVGGRTGVAIAPVSEKREDCRFQQGSVGLHHVCFRARNREDVDEIYRLAERLDANIVRKPEQGRYAPGYYSTLFEDPDGIRIEVNFVPGKGLLDPGVS